MEDKKENKKINNFPELENDSDIEGIEDEISAKYCPYIKARNFFKRFFPKNATLEYLENFHLQNPHIINTSKYPSLPSSMGDSKRCPFGFTSSSPFFSHPKKTGKAKCPYAFSSDDEEKGFSFDDIKKEKKNSKKNEKNEKNTINDEEEDDDSGDEIPKGGCPVMGKYRGDPINKDFEPHYEIPLYGPYDFLFFLRGGLSDEKWIEKTQKIRSLPRHLKYTIFYQHQKELREVHKFEFPKVFFIFDEIKQKGIRYYNRRKYRESLEYLNYAYALMKWIEFKDVNRQENFLKKPSLDGILDEDINIKSCYMDAPEGQEESFKSCVVYILLLMAYCFIELRHYSSAIGCLNECEEIAGDLVPDVFLRRAQARMYNKNSGNEEILKAQNDIEKAIKLGEQYNIDIKKEYDETSPIYRRIIDLEIYYRTKKKLDKIIDDKIDKKVYGIRRIIGKICDKEHENMNHEQAMLIESLVLSRKEDITRYYKVLKEMKKQYKQIIQFFSETNNPTQLDLIYYEYESFMERYGQFKFYYKFEIDSIDPKAINRLKEEEKKMLMDETQYDFYLKRIMHLCEDIYSHGAYNVEIFQFSFDTVLEEERMQREEEEKRQEALTPKKTWSDYFINISKGKFGIYLSICFVILTLFAIFGQFFL